MKKIAIITDSNSGLTQAEANDLGIFIIPMPFNIDGTDYLEGINLSTEEFYRLLGNGADVHTSQPAIGDILDLWNSILKDYDEIVHIPMSSSMSSSYETAQMLSKDFNGKVYIVNNQRISISQKNSVFEAMELAKSGKNAIEIKDFLEKTKSDSSIYITLDTLKYLKKGGRITPAAATLGELLKIKPVLQIQCDKLDAFSKARTKKQAKKIMLDAIKNDIKNRFNSPESGEGMVIQLAYTGEKDEIMEFYKEVKEIYPNHQINADPLSLSVSCHIGPGAIAIACMKKHF
ncbi:MAG: DegV family protein [Anaerotignaceae bacterium]